MKEAIHSVEDILVVGGGLVNELKLKAFESPRKRFRLCMHHTLDHRTHEMIIVFHRDSFMMPHRHPRGKSESYHVIEGSMTVCLFDDFGELKRSIELGRAGGDRAFMYRLSSNEWHMPVATSEWLVYHETYTGPFEKEYDVEFPDWAPLEADRSAVKKFLDKLFVKRGDDGNEFR